MMKRFLLLALFIIVSFRSYAEKFQDGDIIFQRMESGQANAISAATHSEYTHVGIIFYESGQGYVYEAVQPVTKTPLNQWIQRTGNDHYVVKRLKHQERILTPRDTEKLKKEVMNFVGKDYDVLFGWSDDLIYCSELVWKAYKKALNIEVGALRCLRDFDLSSGLVKQSMKERYGKNIPYDMVMISPADIFASNLLETVKEG